MYKVFDWDKAAEIIKNSQPTEAKAGLIEDWFWTGGTIYQNGRIVPKRETYCCLGSYWATPVLVVDLDPFPCYLEVNELTEELNAETYWPQDAIDILNGVLVDSKFLPDVKLLGDGRGN